MTDLFTWDYTTLVGALSRPILGLQKVGLQKDNDLGTINRQELVEIGFLVPKVELVKRAYTNVEDRKTFFHITEEGKRWVQKVEATWDEQTEGTAWWSVQTSHGGCILGLPDFLHPEEAETDLRVLLGSGFAWAQPRNDDHSPGNPVKLTKCTRIGLDGVECTTDWKPWFNPGQAWIDCRSENESAAHFRGAYMRLHGAPFDPGLSFVEELGHIPPKVFDDETAVEKLCFLDSCSPVVSSKA